MASPLIGPPYSRCSQQCRRVRVQACAMMFQRTSPGAHLELLQGGGQAEGKASSLPHQQPELSQQGLGYTGLLQAVSQLCLSLV
jgi:hypothetical protein